MRMGRPPPLAGLRPADPGAVLHYPDDAPPAFGSRLELLASQVVPDAVSYTIVQFFRDPMRAPVNCSALDTLLALDGDWLAAILYAAPAAWHSPFDTDSIIEFWHDKRHARADFARQWTTQP